MNLNKIAALLLIFTSALFIVMVLFYNQVSGTALGIGAIALLAAGALMFYLYYAGRFSARKRWTLILVFIMPNVLLLLWSLWRH